MFTPETYAVGERAVTILNVRAAIQAIPDEVIMCAQNLMSPDVYVALQREKGEIPDYEDYRNRVLTNARSRSANSLSARDDSDMERIREEHEGHSKRLGNQLFCPRPDTVTFLSPYEIDAYELKAANKINSVVIPVLLILCGAFEADELRDHIVGQKWRAPKALSVLARY